jgi:citronellol/citronellal dehydrogenase
MITSCQEAHMSINGSAITMIPTNKLQDTMVGDTRDCVQDHDLQPASYRSIFSQALFAGSVVIVTGGGSGIGRCTAHELASLGAVLALIGRKPEKLATVAREITDDGGTVTTHPCDIRDEEQVQATVRRILATHGRIDGLVNNAGGQFPAPLASISQKGWDAVVRNNLTGGFLMARECFVQCMERNGGAIVNIVADMWNGMPGLGHSGAARAGMVNFTETAAVEWAPAGVRVNAVAPGWIASSGMDTYPESRRPLIRRLPRLIPMQRMGTEAEVSAAIVFLLSPAAAFISGATLRVDGAAPNARRQADLPQHRSSRPWNGFHRYKIPEVLRDDA